MTLKQALIRALKSQSSAKSFCKYLLTSSIAIRMEHGSLTDSRNSTFSLMDEDHTLANAVRFVLNKDPRVEFCGYSIPHPSENKVNIRVQTTGDSAKEVLKDSFQDMILLCEHVRSTFEASLADFKSNNP